MNEQDRSKLEGMNGEAEAYMELMLSTRQMKQQLRFSAACVAMQGLLANAVYTTAGVAGGLTPDDFIKGIAVDSVRHADALIAELDKEPTP